MAAARARGDQLGADCALLRAQAQEIGRWLMPLTAEDAGDAAGAGDPVGAFARPSVLPGWDVRTLLGHLVLIVGGLAPWLERPSRNQPLTALQFVAGYRPAADGIAAATESRTGRAAPAELIEALLAGAQTASEAVAGRAADEVIEAPRGPILVGDWIATRLLDVAVHADDLSRSLPERPPAPFAPGVLRRCARILAAMIAEAAPGRTVELRIPPAAAVQIVQGPRHTRGTPPNVVETDPLTWLRLATGRAQFADEVRTGAVRASGARADLTALLPLFS